MGCIQRCCCFFSKHTFVIYWSFLIIVHIVVYLQNIDTDRCFLWLVSIFYLHQFLPTTLQTSDIVQTNVQMHQVSDTYRPILTCSFILCMILYCTIYIYIYVAYIYSNYCCIFWNSNCIFPGDEIGTDAIIWTSIHIHGFLWIIF